MEGNHTAMSQALLLLLLHLGRYSGVNSVEIVSMKVPSSIEAGQDLILDCNYNYREEEQEQLDIKWYFNSSPTPIYQWLPAITTGPQVIDKRFLEHLDLSYEVNTEKYEKHRALHLVNTTHNFSGSYMCKVSSFVDEDFDQRDVYILVPPQTISIDSNVNGEEDITNITCRGRGIFPIPEGKISVNLGVSSAVNTETVIEMGEDGLADITIRTQYPSPVGVGSELVILCEIIIPHTDIVYTHNSTLAFNIITLEAEDWEPDGDDDDGGDEDLHAEIDPDLQEGLFELDAALSLNDTILNVTEEFYLLTLDNETIGNYSLTDDVYEDFDGKTNTTDDNLVADILVAGDTDYDLFDNGTAATVSLEDEDYEGVDEVEADVEAAVEDFESHEAKYLDADPQVSSSTGWRAISPTIVSTISLASMLRSLS